MLKIKKIQNSKLIKYDYFLFIYIEREREFGEFTPTEKKRKKGSTPQINSVKLFFNSVNWSIIVYLKNNNKYY
jgi:hypothetical protein